MTPVIDFDVLYLLNPLLLGCLMTFLLAILLPPGFLPWLYNLCGIVCCAALVSRSYCSVSSGEVLRAFEGILVFDPLASFATLFLGIVGLIVFLKGPRYLERNGQGSGEFYLLSLASLVGMALTVSTKHFTGLFLGIETMTIPLYFLLSANRQEGHGRAAALKYLALGGVGSALLLYGIALIYGQTGQLTFPETFAAGLNMGTLGALFLVFGILFKIGAFPFQAWVPDVYGAAPTPLTGFMATGVKVAVFTVLLRLVSPLIEINHIQTFLPWIALLTMTIGNLMALGHKSPKEVLAYSSIAHTGYLLIGFCVGAGAIDGILMYLAAYTVMTLGAFAVLSSVPGNEVKSLQGLLQNRPAYAVGFALCILSLAGIPPLVGFHGKLLLFQAAWSQDHLQWLVIGAIINSLIALGYYLPLVKWSLFAQKTEQNDQTSRSLRLNLACFLSALAVVLLGFFPQTLLNLIGHIKI